MKNELHWATSFVGKKWKPGARGPDQFDCWGLVHFIYASRYGIALPSHIGVDPAWRETVAALIEQGSKTEAWTKQESPREGMVVAMSRTVPLHHVGLYVETPQGGYVLHAYEGHSVVAQPVAALRKAGWARIEFYQHTDFKW